MKMLSETKSLKKLQKLKTDFQSFVRENYEYKAKSCLTCPTQGVCCTDAHFVNVHITRLEAVAIRKTLEKFSEGKQREIFRHIEETVKKYDLKSSGNTFAQTFACPLFEKGIGCLVHTQAKPTPCIQHACYEKKEDLPPDELQEQAETQIKKLNLQTYKHSSRLPLPVWLNAINPFKKK